MSHHQGLTNFAHEHGVFRLSLESTLIVNDSLLGLLDVHEGRGYEFEILNTALSIQDL